MLTNFKYAVEEANQEPRRSIHKAASVVLKDHTRSSQNCHQHVSEIDAINGWGFPKVSKEEDKLDEHDYHTTMLSRTSSGLDWISWNSSYTFSKI
jgi:hypothetical protein